MTFDEWYELPHDDAEKTMHYEDLHRSLCLYVWNAAIAAEREACAKVCDEISNNYDKKFTWDAAIAYAEIADECADAIRARGETK